MLPVSNMMLLLRTKFRVNRTINRCYIPKNIFNMAVGPIFDLQNFDILLRDCYWNKNLHQQTKFR